MDFIHLPAGASIKIFTSRGEHVVSLQHDSNIQDGTVSWNLKTKENLDVAPGVYFYVVESSVGKRPARLELLNENNNYKTWEQIMKRHIYFFRFCCL